MKSQLNKIDIKRLEQARQEKKDVKISWESNQQQ